MSCSCCRKCASCSRLRRVWCGLSQPSLEKVVAEIFLVVADVHAAIAALQILAVHIIAGHTVGPFIRSTNTVTVDDWKENMKLSTKVTVFTNWVV